MLPSQSRKVVRLAAGQANGNMSKFLQFGRIFDKDGRKVESESNCVGQALMDVDAVGRWKGEACFVCGRPCNKNHKLTNYWKRLAEAKDKKVHAVGTDGAPSTATVAAVEDTGEIDEECWADDNGTDTSEAWVFSVEDNDVPADAEFIPLDSPCEEHTCPGAATRAHGSIVPVRVVAPVDEDISAERRSPTCHRQRRGQRRLKECGLNEKPAILRHPDRAHSSWDNHVAKEGSRVAAKFTTCETGSRLSVHENEAQKLSLGLVSFTQRQGENFRNETKLGLQTVPENSRKQEEKENSVCHELQRNHQQTNARAMKSHAYTHTVSAVVCVVRRGKWPCEATFAAVSGECEGPGI